MAPFSASRRRDAARSLRDGAAFALRGAAMTAAHAGGLAVRAGRELVRLHPRAAAAALAEAAARLLLQIPADGLLMVAGRLLSALQTILGLEAVGRPLTAEEEVAATAVFGDALPLAPVRLKAGRCGVLGLPGRPFAHGDLIFVPAAWRPGLETAVGWRPLLVHELIHVWQHRRYGTRYLTEALLAQAVGAGYNFAAGLAAGRPFARLNREQQAEMIERAWTAGCLQCDGSRRFLVRLLDPSDDLGFEVAGVEAGDEATAGRFAARGFADRSAELAAALELLRRPLPSLTGSRRSRP